MLALVLFAVVAPGAATAFDLLLERKHIHGRVSAHLVRTVAELCGKSEDTIWRWLRDGSPPQRPSFELNDAEKHALAACNCNVSKMVAELKKAGKARASLRTYQRAVNSSMTPAEKAFFRKGDKGWRAATIHMPITAEHRGQVFHADHTLLKIWLRTKQRRRWVQVWLTVVLDAYSRRVMGWALSLQPNEGVVLAVLRQAFSGEHGCIPERMVWDNGAEFLANAVTDAAKALVFEAHPIDPYSPWQNGKVERFFGTVNTHFLAGQPFYQRGPRGHNRKLYGPNEGPLKVEEFAQRFAAWIDEYNRERPHSALDGKTPDQVWCDPPTAVRRVGERALDFMLLREKESRVIGPYGVRHNNRFYYADELLAHTSREVDVRYMPFDNRQIWLFEGDEFIAKAIPWEELPGPARARFLTKRSGTLRSARAKLPSRTTTTDERANSTFLPLTSPGDFESGDPETTGENGDAEARAGAVNTSIYQDSSAGDLETEDPEQRFPDLNEVIE